MISGWHLPDGMTGEACFSPCGKYRLWLQRWWGFTTPYALWIGMNPSTATADVDDPTVRKEIEFTRRMGLTCYVKCNVMDYIATNPKDLLRPPLEPRSPRNLNAILQSAISQKHTTHPRCARVIVAWGNFPKRLRGYGLETAEALRKAGVKMECLGTNNDGSPKHPLYMSYSTPLVAFE